MRHRKTLKSYKNCHEKQQRKFCRKAKIPVNQGISRINT